MSAPQILLQAAVQRLGARLGSGLMDAAASLSVLAQDAPERLREELQLFWQEVEAEADRLERGEPQPEPGVDAGSWAPPPAATSPDPQRQIDQLRARIAALAHRLEQP